MACVVALDVGGSSVKSGVVHVAKRPDVVVTTTPIDSRGNREAILETLAGVLGEHLRVVRAQPCNCLGVGIGFPGPFDYERGVARLHGVDKYAALYGTDLSAEFGRVVGDWALRLAFGNDAVGAVLAEARYGAGRERERVLGVVLGTGMGSAFILGGKHVTAGHGVPDGGFLYAELFKDAAADEVFSTRGLQARLREVSALTDIPDAAAQARAGHLAFQAVFAKFGRDLGTFLTSYVTAFQVDALVVLGGLAHTSDLFADGLAHDLPVPYYTGLLGIRAGVIGASLLIEI